MKKLMPQYDMEDNRYPSGLCVKCVNSLSRFKTGKIETVSAFKKYEPAPINVKDENTDCHCFMCKVDHKKNSLFEKQDKQDVLRCDHCFTKLMQGKPHNCSKQSLFENVLSLDENMLDMIANEHLRRKNMEEIHLVNINGGKPLIVSLGRKQDPQTKTTNIFTHEKIDHMEKDIGVGQKKMYVILRYIRSTFGKHSVEPYWRETVIEENEAYQEFFDVEDTEFKNSKGKPINVPYLYPKDTVGLLDKVAVERGYTGYADPRLEYKFGTDSGKGFTKTVISIFDSEKLKLSKQVLKTKRRTYSQMESEDSLSLVGPMKTIMLGNGEGIPESDHNCRIMYDKMKLKDVPGFSDWYQTGDFKMHNISCGTGPCSSSFPCYACEAQRLGRIMVYEDNTRLRTPANVVENNTNFKNRKGKEIKADTTAKGYKSCISTPLVPVDDPNVPFLRKTPPPPLHIKLGIVNKILLYIHVEWEKLDEGENGVDKYLASLNIIKENYFGLTLEGPNCDRVLNNIKKLEDVLPNELQPFADLLRSFKKINDNVFGYTLHEDWESFIDQFTTLHDKVMKEFPGNVTETVKAHALMVHVRQFLHMDGCKRGLAELSEQELETAHQTFHKIWQRLKVMDKKSPAYKINLLRAVAIFNRLHT